MDSKARKTQMPTMTYPRCLDVHDCSDCRGYEPEDEHRYGYSSAGVEAVQPYLVDELNGEDFHQR